MSKFPSLSKGEYMEPYTIMHDVKQRRKTARPINALGSKVQKYRSILLPIDKVEHTFLLGALVDDHIQTFEYSGVEI